MDDDHPTVRLLTIIGVVLMILCCGLPNFLVILAGVARSLKGLGF